jgi:hypothetical protein
MDFRDLLRVQRFDADSKNTIVLLRHRPFEPKLARAMPWMISERPDLFEAYQSVPGRPETAISKAELVASFLGIRPGTAHFVGLYRVRASRPLDLDAFWSIPENQVLRDLGYLGFTPEQAAKSGTLLQFDLELLPFYTNWRGRLAIDFSPPERAWFRWVDRGIFPVRAILEESAFAPQPADWHQIDLTFGQLAVLPQSWRARLAEWRGVYLIYDESDAKAYVGSAYGRENILSRWQAYVRDGHGGNRELRGRDPKNFRFTILERLSPDLPPDEVIAKEASWKLRIHSRIPHGLNAN